MPDARQRSAAAGARVRARTAAARTRDVMPRAFAPRMSELFRHLLLTVLPARSRY